jgi:hypothetical protein
MDLHFLPNLTIHHILEFIYGKKPLYFHWDCFWNWMKRNANIIKELENKYYPCYYWAGVISYVRYNDSGTPIYKVQVYSPHQRDDINNNCLVNTTVYTYIDQGYRDEDIRSLLIYHMKEYVTVGSIWPSSNPYNQ